MREHRLVKVLGIVIAVTYVAVLLQLLLHCRPIQRNWQIKPYAGGTLVNRHTAQSSNTDTDQCTLYYASYYTVTILNVLTDVGILCFIPVPIIWKVKIPIQQKVLVGLLLCSGLFIIAAAIIRCVLSIQNIRSIDTSGVWAIRETFVTIIAINAPCIKPLFSSRRVKNHKTSGYELKSRHNTGSTVYIDADRDSSTGSQVKIMSTTVDEENDPAINVTTVVTVETFPAESDQSGDTNTCRVAIGTPYRR